MAPIKKTKEQLLSEPMPVFDCVYCVSHSVFKLISNKTLALKYQTMRPPAISLKKNTNAEEVGILNEMESRPE